jgi:cysteinyl-tRNA synthetase
MDEDFATPEAISVLFDAVRDANRALDAGEDATGLASAVHEIVDVLGLRPPDTGLEDVAADIGSLADRVGCASADSPEETLEALLGKRASARADKDFATSDAIRDGLAAIGIVVEDTADGARWHRA